ncbi:hypothetical protein ACFO9Q_00385 [Paenibacillus sp. GCM10023252]|uniref:hypothetical protein n=1 Tax=Paenibacillus sp. GCM10023252 TaxID=3252649 RepID=UPI00360962D3
MNSSRITIIGAEMTYTKEDGYVGKVQFEAEGDPNQYEIALQRKRGNKEYAYGLFFRSESGKEEYLLAMEDRIEEDDDLYESLIAAAEGALKKEEEQASKE